MSQIMHLTTKIMVSHTMLKLITEKNGPFYVNVTEI